MAWLLMSIVLSAAFGHVMRHAQHRRRYMLWVGAWNYTVAAALSWLWWALTPGAPMTGPAAVWGTVAGTSFVLSYFIMDPCLRQSGVGLTQAVGRLSVIVPVVASILIWSETPGPVRALGLVVALVAFPFIAAGRALPHDARGRWTAPLLVVFFVTQGIGGLAFKAYAQQSNAGGEPAFCAFLFTAASLGSVLAAGWKEPVKTTDAVHGAALGAVNIAGSFVLLRALAALPGTVVFPTTSAGAILLSAGAAMVLWGERFRGKALIGLGLAAAALVLINLGK
jgi:multidrug transporter EmrE-like cation transporter